MYLYNRVTNEILRETHLYALYVYLKTKIMFIIYDFNALCLVV